MLCQSLLCGRWLFFFDCKSNFLTGCTNISNDEQGETAMNNTQLEFYSRHPSGIKIHKIETTAMPILEQTVPFDVKTLTTHGYEIRRAYFGRKERRQ